LLKTKYKKQYKAINCYLFLFYVYNAMFLMKQTQGSLLPVYSEKGKKVTLKNEKNEKYFSTRKQMAKPQSFRGSEGFPLCRTAPSHQKAKVEEKEKLKT
jgi:hypothetical protein